MLFLTLGSGSQQCDNNGQCVCKPGVTGPKCDSCEANYKDFGDFSSCGCRPADEISDVEGCNAAPLNFISGFCLLVIVSLLLDL